ncbi:MAG: hypothetical protein RR205_00715 [Oscillospiraceae bacterium]
MNFTKRFAAIMLAMLFVITTFVACGNTDKSTTEQSNQEVKATGEYDKVVGKYVPFNSEKMNFSPIVAVKGSKEALNEWHSFIDTTSKDIAYMYVGDATNKETEASITSAQIESIMKILKECKPTVFDKSVAEPNQEHAVDVVAFDAKESLLWHISYDGRWLVVEHDGKMRIYNSENSGLESLRDYIKVDKAAK